VKGIIRSGQFEGDDEKPGHKKDIFALCESFVSFEVKALNRKGRGSIRQKRKVTPPRIIAVRLLESLGHAARFSN